MHFCSSKEWRMHKSRQREVDAGEVVCWVVLAVLMGHRDSDEMAKFMDFN